jgi:hypothetical protein
VLVGAKHAQPSPIFSRCTLHDVLRTLPASLKDDTARMNDRNKHKVTGQMNHQTADPKANASVFLFFPTAHFLKTILASRTNGTFGFARHTSRPFAKPKEPFFANAPTSLKPGTQIFIVSLRD